MLLRTREEGLRPTRDASSMSMSRGGLKWRYSSVLSFETISFVQMGEVTSSEFVEDGGEGRQHI